MRRFFLIFAAALLTPYARAADPDFNRDVRPILSQFCFQCHGPDSETRKGRLRLDIRESALKGGRSGEPAIVPGQPEASELIRRILSEDESDVMPPPALKKSLTAAHKDILKRWVAAGGNYAQHWAFVKPTRPTISSINKNNWDITNPIDTFILARLEREGLSPSPMADRHTLVRRVYLDLIGLPPTPAEAEAFVKDESPDAYEKLVDRLLASPHYGERWARPWLDLARYADTNGYEKDRPRSIWPYRDWVIQALNADMPFDQFTIEQIAGDLLPGASLSQLVATGFHRNTMLNEEGGIDPLEFHYYAVADRVNTTGTVWLGLTLGCAQCHTHKFDPIPHIDYFRIFAFLNNTEEPEIEVPSAEQIKQRAEIEAKARAMEAELPKKVSPVSFAWWLVRERRKAVDWNVIRPSHTEAGLTRLTQLSDGSLLASGDATKHDVYELTFTDLPAGVTAFRLEAIPDERLPGGGPGRAYYEGFKGDFLLGDWQLSLDGKPVVFAGASASHERKGFTAALALDDNLQSGWSGAGKAGVGSTAVFIPTAPLPAAKEVILRLTFERHYSASLGRFRIAVTTDTRPVTAREIPDEIEALLRNPQPSPQQLAQLRSYYATIAPELKPAREAILALRKQLPAVPTTLVMKERPTDHPRQTYLRHRGEYLQPTEQVQPGVLSALHPLPPDEPLNRLTFARWLVSPENPLVARVTVNRAWAAFFGRGIVPTVDDFGYQGEPPTHPELLDWLAVEFMEQGWSLKRLHRLIVTSSTYRQSSRITEELYRKDPNNKLLARGPRVRLEAEMIRDSALRASGQLSSKIGGPSVFPPQPPGATDTAYAKTEWKVSTGEDRYRRGLYTFTKRTTPYAMFATFDAPSGEACVARREVSNSPLQALTMLNDSVVTEAAQELGRVATMMDGTALEKASTLFRRCLTRPPEPDEAALLVKFFEAQVLRFHSDQKAANALAGRSERNIAEHAAWTAVARTLLNLDEFVTKE